MKQRLKPKLQVVGMNRAFLREVRRRELEEEPSYQKLFLRRKKKEELQKLIMGLILEQLSLVRLGVPRTLVQKT